MKATLNVNTEIPAHQWGTVTGQWMCPCSLGIHST